MAVGVALAGAMEHNSYMPMAWGCRIVDRDSYPEFSGRGYCVDAFAQCRKLA